ncbi:MAG TPA: protein kinase [Verrucomicrobiae bacterium]|nr:protein kinase [Verrucomicrobiae bacterium]
MSNEAKCPQCGAALPEDAPAGLCPRCLMALNLKTETVLTGEPPVSSTTPALTPEQLAPHFPQFEILEFLGRGGMGVVYKVRQKTLNRIVALKLLAPERIHDPRFAERFAREAQALAALNHPNIVTVHDFGQAGGFYFLLMEFVDGVNLRQLLRARKFTPEEALAIVPPLCDALQFAHERGIIHRDIKPENLLLDKAGRVKIADFGIAKMLSTTNGDSAASGGARESGTQSQLGTPGYSAPEQKTDPQRVDSRADIYSLGAVFYEMLTGELPGKRIEPPSKKVQVDVRLDAVVLRALEKTPELRWQTAQELRTQLETLAADSPLLHSTKPKGAIVKIRSVIALVLAAAILGAAAATLVIMKTKNSGGNSQQLAQQGWQLWQQRNWNQAIASFQKAIDRDPKNIEAWNGLGWATFNSGKAQDAETIFEHLLSLDPMHPAALNGLGQIYLSQKKYDAAETNFLKAAPAAPAAWYGLARLYLLQGKFEEAEKWAQKLVESGQGDQTAEKMLEAAKKKELPDGLRAMIEPRD